MFGLFFKKKKQQPKTDIYWEFSKEQDPQQEAHAVQTHPPVAFGKKIRFG